MAWLVASVALVPVLALGTGLGWYLRKKERWCGRCGGYLRCRICMAIPARFGTETDRARRI